LDYRLRVIENEIPLGAAEARNVGAAVARGTWLAFLDDDDEWAPNKIERQLAAAGSPNESVIISCLAEIRTLNKKHIWPRRIYDNLSPLADYLFDRKSILKGETGLQTSCLMMPRVLFDTLRFTYAHDDWDLLLRAVRLRNARIVTVTEPLVIFHQSETRDSLSTSFPWRSSLEWIEANQSYVSRRAYSGFCLTVVAPQAAKAGNYSVFFMLLYLAFRNGLPRPIHIIIYLYFWFRLRPFIGGVFRRVASLVLTALQYHAKHQNDLIRTKTRS
jgi:glycosyltransferase involved in cell wall biosynthesis